MPKIKNIYHTFGSKRLELEIHYSKKNNFFIKGGLPLWILNVLGNEIITELYSSPEDIDNAIKLYAEDYNLAVHTSKKVIVYNITFSNNTIEYLNIIGTKYNGSIGNRSNGFGFSFNYKICLEHNIDDKRILKEFVNLNYNSDELSESFHVYKPSHDEIIIDYTLKREEFFQNLKNSTNDLCKNILEFFGKEDKEKLKAIDSGNKLLN